jgi:hypothetical protein
MGETPCGVRRLDGTSEEMMGEPNMTRKDVALAHAFRSTRPDTTYALGERGHDERVAALAQWRDDMLAVCNVLADDNPRFNRDKFIEACTGQSVGSNADPESMGR